MIIISYYLTTILNRRMVKSRKHRLFRRKFIGVHGHVGVNLLALELSLIGKLLLPPFDEILTVLLLGVGVLLIDIQPFVCQREVQMLAFPLHLQLLLGE